VGQASAFDLSQLAFVVLSDLTYIPEGFQENLRKYLRSGGSVWLVLGPSVAVARRAALLDGATIEDRYFARNAERFQTASYLDTGHASVAAAGNWQGVRFYQAVNVRVPQAKTIARLGDGTPVLFEVPAGLGRILVFTSTFDNVWNDFPLHAAFVPFIEQTARYLGGAGDAAPYLTVDSHIELRRAADRATAVEVIGPDGGRALSLKEAASAPAFALEREGFYEVRRGNGRQQLVAVNADRRESNFEPVPGETLALWQKTGEGGAAPAQAAAQQQARVNLWWYVLLAAALLAVAESWVGNRHLTEQAAGEPARELHKEAAA
jgi:hypothetical protein